MSTSLNETGDSMPKVAMLNDYAGVALDLADWSPVQTGADVAVFDRHLSEEDAVEAQQSFDVVCTPRERMAFPRTLIERLKNLKMITVVGMNLPNLDVAAASGRGVLVIHSKFANPRFSTIGNATPELAWGLIMATVRKLAEEHRRMREGGWQATTGLILSGKTLGLVGLGRVGKRITERKGVWDGGPRLGPEFDRRGRSGGRCAPGRERGSLQRSRRGLYPLGTVGADTRSRRWTEITLMKPSAYLINTSRGPITQEAALIAALRARRIVGAGLDVYDVEPLPPDHTLRSLPNVTVSPHLGYVAREMLGTVYSDTVEAVTAWLDGKPVRIANHEALQREASTGYNTVLYPAEGKEDSKV